MCTAAVVTPDSYQTLAYLSAQYEWSEPLCVGISTVCIVFVLHITLRLPQFFSSHSSARISERCLCTRLVSAYIVALFQCFRMVPVSCSSGGRTKTCHKKAHPSRTRYDWSIRKQGFSTQSGKKLQLETLNSTVDSLVYKTPGKVGAYSFLFVCKRLWELTGRQGAVN